MEQRVALVTGASQGIGRATALELSQRGFSLVLAARNSTALNELASEITATGALCVPVTCDITKSGEATRMFEQCKARFGRIDVLINNAGIGQFVSLGATSDAIWNATIAVNLTGTFHCCREVLPYFESIGGGHIINNASIAAVRGFANFAAYSAGKAGVVGFSRAIREELRSRKIRVSVVLPGATDSPFWDKVEGEWDRSRMIRASDVARVIANIAEEPETVLTEEVVVMPAGGAL